MNKWKWGAIAALVIIAFIGGCKHGQQSILKQTSIDTAVTTKIGAIDHTPKPISIKRDTIYYAVAGQDIHDTLEIPGTIEYLPADTPQWATDVLNDWGSTRMYDTLLINGGDSIHIMDRVTHNRIASRRIRAIWRDSLITKTVILKPPRNTVGYFTLSGAGDRKGVDGIGMGFALKNRNDVVYNVEYKRLFGLNPKPNFELRLMLPIHLRK